MKICPECKGGNVQELLLVWHGDDPAMDEPCGPSDEEMLDSLDAYGHCRYTVSEEYPDEPERESDTLLAFDWNVFAHPEHRLGDLIVSFEVVLDQESNHMNDTIDSGIFCIDGWTDDQIRQWGGAPLANCIDGVNEGLAMSDCPGFIGWEQIEKFEATVTKQFVEDVARARKKLDGQDEEGGK